ncbi:MAG: hypothetical protein FJ357_04665 [Thaumarchaeota archaeon]|nr:hypothetical protein [Nitrososphaerota archaeon]
MSIEEKQWLTTRLDLAHTTLFDEFQLARDDFGRIREDLTSSVSSARNYLLSSVAFVSVLLTTLQQIGIIVTFWFIVLLMLDLSIGLITFIVSSKVANSIKSCFFTIENSIVGIQQTLNHKFGFVITQSMDLNVVQISTLKEYWDLLHALSGIVYIPLSNALILASKERFLEKYYKDLFMKNATMFEQSIDSAIKIYKNTNKTNLPAQSVEYITKTIELYDRPSLLHSKK